MPGASLENDNSDTPWPRYYSRQGARRALQFLARKLSPDDLATAWKMIEARLDPNEQPRRGNGDAHR